MQNGYLLRVENLHLQRQEKKILRGVTFEIAPWEVFALLGRNGSGKSSLAYTLMGCAGYTPPRGVSFSMAKTSPISPLPNAHAWA